MGPFEMVVGIVLIVTIGSIVRAKHGIRRDPKGGDYLSLRTMEKPRRCRPKSAR